jgi:CheY-like chemotaxis protein
MPRILCIDDNKHGCFARQSLLEDHGHDVVVATAGKEGLERFGTEKFDLVIVDYFMPGMNGGEVIRKIREMNARVPIIMLSGYVERLGLDEKVPEADAALQKGPREIKELLETVTRLLRKRYKRPAAKARAAKERKAKKR